MLSIQTNVAAMSAENNVTATNSNLQQSMERLSSGFRINRAADDAAGLAISEKMQAQIGGLNQAVRNANDGVSMIQTAEGALDQVQTMMTRVRNLSVQAASDTNGADERSAINVEIQQLKSEIDNISQRTTFNGLGLLNGKLVTQADTTSLATLKAVALGANTDGAVSGVDAAAATDALGTTYTFGYTAGADDNSGVMSLASGAVGGLTANANVTDIAANGTETLNFSTLGISVMVKAGPTALTAAEVGAIAGQTIKTSTTLHSAVLQTGADATAANTTQVSMLDTRLTGGTSSEMAGLATAISTFNTAASAGTATATDATNLITALDTADNWISSQRANLGAAQNRLGYAAASLSTTSQNVAAANSQIRDVDVASESANMSKNQILMQAGISVLAQANQVSQLALKLLNG